MTEDKLAALIAERKRVENSCIDIERQLYEAKAKAFTDKKFKDAQWFSAAQYALKKNRQKEAALNVDIKYARKELNQVHTVSHSANKLGILTDILKRRLSDDLLDEIWEELDFRMSDQTKPSLPRQGAVSAAD